MSRSIFSRITTISRSSLEEFSRRVHEAGGFISHAHPYRFKSYMAAFYDPIPTWCDGAEVYNFSDSQEANEKAEALAASHGLIRTSGADTHWSTSEGIGKAGMAFPYRVRTSEELVKALRSGDGKLIIDGELRDTLYK